MINRRKLFLHVGYPKTATTTLQKKLFARHPGICYLGKPLTGDLLDIEQHILRLDSVQFERALPGLQEKFIALSEDCPEQQNMLLSHEGFLRAARYEGHDIGRTAERLRQVFGDPLAGELDVHVLITIRKQIDIIPSYFFDSVSRSPDSFHRFIDSSLEQPQFGYFPSLFYDQVVGYYSALFGRERIRVLPFEAFITEREHFLYTLAAYLEIDAEACLGLVGGKSHNVKLRAGEGYRLSAYEYVLDRVNKRRTEVTQLPKTLRFLLKRIPLKNYVFALSPDERNRIQALFADCNRQLSGEFNLDLEEYDYF
jgi:hypothetical protein